MLSVIRETCCPRPGNENCTSSSTLTGICARRIKPLFVHSWLCRCVCIQHRCTSCSLVQFLNMMHDRGCTNIHALVPAACCLEYWRWRKSTVRVPCTAPYPPADLRCLYCAIHDTRKCVHLDVMLHVVWVATVQILYLEVLGRIGDIELQLYISTIYLSNPFQLLHAIKLTP